jgi:hypothetical protein
MNDFRSKVEGERCARCGAPFHCGARAGDERCWCFEQPPVKLADAKSCLCPKCLKEAAAKGRSAPGPRS